MKKLLLTVALFVVLALSTATAQAFVLDLESGIVGGPGAYSYTNAGTTVNFDGTVSTGVIADHTLGSTEGHVWVPGSTFTFTGGLDDFSFYVYSTNQGVSNYTISYYDAANNLLGSNTSAAVGGLWLPSNINVPSGNIYKIVGTGSQGLVFDDFGINAVPEPMSLLLLGSGLLGLVGFKKRA